MTTSRVLFGLIGSTLIFVAHSSAKADPRAVIELFTSKGCSSCPAADKLLSELQADPSLIPLSLPIDYWDYLGWKDTLAIPGHTTRQRAYSQMRGDREIYTPQVVVNGVANGWIVPRLPAGGIIILTFATQTYYVIAAAISVAALIIMIVLAWAPRLWPIGGAKS